jgi:hypothetical protein
VVVEGENEKENFWLTILKRLMCDDR